MSELNVIDVLAKGWKKVLSFALAAAVFGAVFSFFFPLQYGSTMRLLVIQRQLSQVDPYTAIRASERISDNLAQVIYTTAFFERVLDSKFNVDSAAFPSDEAKRRKRWREMISTEVVRGSGMLIVTVYHIEPEQATQIARAIAFVLTTEGWQFVGGGDLQIRLVDQPIASRFPVRPNIPANALSGFILGLMAGSLSALAEHRKMRVFGRG